MSQKVAFQHKKYIFSTPTLGGVDFFIYICGVKIGFLSIFLS